MCDSHNRMRFVERGEEGQDVPIVLVVVVCWSALLRWVLDEAKTAMLGKPDPSRSARVQFLECERKGMELFEDNWFTPAFVESAIELVLAGTTGLSDLHRERVATYIVGNLCHSHVEGLDHTSSPLG